MKTNITETQKQFVSTAKEMFGENTTEVKIWQETTSETLQTWNATTTVLATLWATPTPVASC